MYQRQTWWTPIVQHSNHLWNQCLLEVIPNQATTIKGWIKSWSLMLINRVSNLLHNLNSDRIKPTNTAMIDNHWIKMNLLETTTLTQTRILSSKLSHLSNHTRISNNSSRIQTTNSSLIHHMNWKIKERITSLESSHTVTPKSMIKVLHYYLTKIHKWLRTQKYWKKMEVSIS